MHVNDDCAMALLGACWSVPGTVLMNPLHADFCSL